MPERILQNELLKQIIKNQKEIIKQQKKEIIRLNKKFILYFSSYDTDLEITESSDADM